MEELKKENVEKKERKEILYKSMKREEERFRSLWAGDMSCFVLKV